MIVVVNLHVGNLGSIKNMLRKLGADALVSDRQEDIDRAERLILPGVGAFDGVMGQVNGLGLRDALSRAANERRIPLLGICVGMQILGARSQEGDLPGLGWIDGEVVRFKFDEAQKLRVPHVGWNYIDPHGEPLLFQNLEEEARFYFTHSYFMRLNEPAVNAGTATYGHDFVAAVRKKNIMGVQFHPEKSYRHGLKLLSNFLEAKP